MATAAVISGRWTRVRTLGRGASGAVVSLAADEASGALFAVKSAPAGTAAAEHLRREGGILSALRSPHVVPCLGVRAAPDGGCQLLLEFAPGGSLADVAARSSGGGRLGDDERAVAAYAADVARGLAYLHARSLVHGDVKARNVVVGADGRGKLADFGCARAVGSSGSGSASARPTIIGGTPAFMAPEVARGEEQGPAADIWALGCTVVEMATGRAPWSDVVDSLPAAVHRIGYTDAVPEVPAWMSAEAKDFLARCCFARNPRDRCTAAQLLEHPFLLASAAGCGGVKAEGAAAAAERRVSPKSTLDAALWESDADDDSDDEGDVSESPAQRIKALACPCSALPDWDSEEGDWIEVLGEQCEATNLVPLPTKDVAGEDECQLLSEVLETEVDFLDAGGEGDDPECFVAVGLATAPSAELQKEQCRGRSRCNPTVFLTEACCHKIETSSARFARVIRHIFSSNEQYFPTANQSTVFSVLAYTAELSPPSSVFCSLLFIHSAK
ncbi:mitogen-activated protein kinase kinase kinase 18-like [Miscanthus floridulus]|uniref:mitogen-activated protein kinase kinase kinase 18-like n=1 Tax=Miscanthus floridulus TaxID=154761 RepID=UPI00345A4ABD